MANTNLCTAVAIPPAVSESHQPSEPPAAAATLAVTRPSLHRRTCFVAPGPNGLPSQPQSSDSESGSEGYETAPEYTVPARTMPEKRALSCSEERVRRHQESVSSPMSDSDSVQTTLTNTQTKDYSDAVTAADVNEEEVEAIHRRNIKMRDEGVRVTINSSQLASLKPLPAPGQEPTHTNTSGSPPQASSTSPSASSSDPSTSPSLAGLQSPTPAPTPADNDNETVLTTPDHHHSGNDAAPAPSVLPTGGGQDAEVWLNHLGERLLAVPADPVSRRALRDGRAMLFGNGRGRRPRTVPSSAGARASPDRLDMRAGWYPSDLME